MTAKRIYSAPLGSGHHGVALGGVGSGHWSHQGVPGELGGSAPGDRQSGNKPKDAGTKAADTKAEIARLAKSLHSEAVKQEPELTMTLVNVVEDLGGEMAGLTHRLKKQTSIEGKISRDVRDGGVSPADAAAGLNDTIRYTAVFDPDSFTEDVLEVQSKLEERGWNRYDHKWKNFFSPGNSYQGYNTVMVNSDGLRFELQYHTRETLTIKERAHDIYVTSRELPQHSPQRATLDAEMVSLWTVYDRPDDWEDLPGNIIIR